MGKKINNDSSLKSPGKDNNSSNGPNYVYSKMNSESDHKNNSNNSPFSNDAKRCSKPDGQAGTGSSVVNPKVQQQRDSTLINQFNMIQGSQIPESMNPNDQGDDEGNNDRKSPKQKKDSDYLKFFKFYYEKNKTEHPNWKPFQITTIVSLLWKKKKAHDKNPQPKESCGNTSRRSNKPLTAKDAFKLKHKDLTKMEMDELWAKLPKQSKGFWKREGDSYGSSARLSEISSVRNSKAPLPILNTMRLLLNQM